MRSLLNWLGATDRSVRSSFEIKSELFEAVGKLGLGKLAEVLTADAALSCCAFIRGANESFGRSWIGTDGAVDFF